MATMTTSQFVSSNYNINTRVGARFDPIIAFVENEKRSNLMTHNGLRSLNKLDMLKSKTGGKSRGKFRSLLQKKKMMNSESVALSQGVIKCGSGMNVVFVGAEVGPWSKTGGLGDVLGGLPPAMAASGHRVMTISPRYDQYKDAWDTSMVLEIKVGDKVETVRFFHCYKRGVDRVFVDHPLFLEKVWGKTSSKIYGPKAGIDYKDNQLRFSLLCQAALEVPRILNLTSNKYFSGPYDEFKGSFDFIDGYEKPVKGRKINWMKAGILESDRVVTVSPYYAQELVSSEDKGVELDNILRTAGITGIVNGMDVQEWNPFTDKYIDVKYNETTVMEAKLVLKEALQAEVGLPIDTGVPVIGFIGRLEEQKGSDILVEAITQLLGEKVQIIILGTGKKRMEQQIEELEIKCPNQARGVAKFDVPLAHKIIAAADFMLIPSRFEPCGLIQLHAMRYGTVPMVASTGGLVDTVKEGFTGFQMGAFNVECEAVDPADVDAIMTTVKRAIKTYDTPAMGEMIQNCMAQDFSWKEPAKKWEKMLLSLAVGGSKQGLDGEEIAPLAKENVATP